LDGPAHPDSNSFGNKSIIEQTDLSVIQAPVTNTSVLDAELIESENNGLTIELTPEQFGAFDASDIQQPGSIDPKGKAFDGVEIEPIERRGSFMSATNNFASFVLLQQEGTSPKAEMGFGDQLEPVQEQDDQSKHADSESMESGPITGEDEDSRRSTLVGDNMVVEDPFDARNGIFGKLKTRSATIINDRGSTMRRRLDSDLDD